MNGDSWERILVAVAAEPHEQRLLIEQPGPAGERVDHDPRLERCWTASETANLALAAALGVDVEAVAAGVGARARVGRGPAARRPASRRTVRKIGT